MEEIKIQKAFFGTDSNDYDCSDSYYMTIIPVLDFICKENKLNLNYPKTKEELGFEYFFSIMNQIDNPKEKKKVLEIFKRYLLKYIDDVSINPYNEMLSEPLLEVFDIGIYNAYGGLHQSAVEMTFNIIYREAANYNIMNLTANDYEIGVKLLCKNSINLLYEMPFSISRVKEHWNRRNLNAEQRNEETKKLVKKHHVKLYTNIHTY